MSWLYSRALVEAYSEATCSDGEPSAPSKSSHMPQAYLSPDRMTAFSRLSRFGMTFAPLKENRGEALLTSFLADFPARTSASQDQAQASTESEAASGEKWHGSFAKYDHDSCSWKTHQHSLLGGLDEYSETWPRWGLMRDGECFQVRHASPLYIERGYSLWPAPNACDATRGSPETPSDKLARGANTGWSLIDVLGYIPHPQFAEWLMGWPVGMTDLKPLAMDKFQQWLRWHGKYCQKCHAGKVCCGGKLGYIECCGEAVDCECVQAMREGRWK